MSNKRSAQDRHVKVISPPLPVSHITLTSRILNPSINSCRSNDTLVEKNLPQTPSLPIISTPPPPSILRPSLSTYISNAQLKSLGEQAAVAYSTFLRAYPEYHNTWIVDTLRRADFARLDRVGETYVDYMGGSQHPECLVRVHSDFLTQNIMGNTHSVSNSSRLSSECADEAREMVLSFFQAPKGYTVIFTPNATGALKLVGEAFPFQQDSSYVLGADSHNSVHGIRC